MKAVVIEKLGPPEVLKIVTDWPKPQRKKPGDVLIRIEATSVNPLDFKTRSGVVPRFLVRLPKVGTAVVIRCPHRFLSFALDHHQDIYKYLKRVL